MDFSIDPLDPAPLYAQLHRALRQAILSGTFAEGEAIPSETVLRDRYGITRTTVRQAVAQLAKEGLVLQMRGKGTLVSYRPVQHTLWNFGSFTEFARARGLKPVTRVLEQCVEAGPEPILKLVRARGVEQGARVEVLNLDTSWLSLTRYPGLEAHDFAKLSLYKTLQEKYGVRPLRAEFHLSVASPNVHTHEAFSEMALGYICAAGDVYDTENMLMERTQVLYSPAQQVRIAMTYGEL